MPLVPGVQITANMLNLLGAADPGSTMTVQLAGYGSQVPRVSGSGMIVSTRPIPLVAPAGGLIAETIWGNQDITPIGTYYTMAFTDELGNVIQLNAYQFLVDGPYDLSSAPLYDPPPPSILALDPVLKNPAGGALQTVAGPLRATVLLELNEPVIVPPATGIFDGSLGNSFKITLSQATNPTFINMTGKSLVVVRVVQPGGAAFAFNWPDTARGAQEVSPAPGYISVQLFTPDTDGSLDAAGPMMYSTR